MAQKDLLEEIEGMLSNLAEQIESASSDADEAFTRAEDLANAVESIKADIDTLLEAYNDLMATFAK